MKLIGAVLIIVAGYVLGRARRGAMVQGERIIDAAVRFLLELRDAVSYSAAGLHSVISRSAQREAYVDLSFLNQWEPGSPNPGAALCVALEDWEYAARLSRDEFNVLLDVFSTIGTDSSRNEIKKLDFAVERLRAALASRRKISEKRKGFYETLFTLLGAAVAIMVI